MEKILLIILIIIITIITILYISYSSYKIDHIIYINLDKRVDRKEQIEGELKKFNLTNYERFSAIENKNGAIGCSKSHLEVIKLAKKRGYKNILVLEDDFQFIVSKEKFNQQVNKLSNINFDVCLLAYNTPNLYKSEYPFLYKIKDAQTASGYLIQAHYYDTLIDCWEKAIKLFEETNDDTKYTCDQSWKKLQEKNNWYCFKTRMGKQRESYSDIQKGVVNYNV